MVKVSRIILAWLVLTAFIVVTPYSIEMVGELEGDPPSIFNDGPGGIGNMVKELVNQGAAVYIVNNVNEIEDYDPALCVAFLLGPQVEISRDDAEKILGWVSAGGTLVLADEFYGSRNLMTLLGLGITNTTRSIATGWCVIDGVAMSALFNVYSCIRGVGKPLCSVGSCVTAVSMRYGKGTIFVFSDSSLWIDEEFDARWSSMYETHRMLLNYVTHGKRCVIFVEAYRVYRYLRINPFLVAIVIPVSFISTLCRIALLYTQLSSRVLFLVTTLAFILSIAATLSIERRRISTAEDREDMREICRAVKEGVERWKNFVEKMRYGSKK